MSDNKLNLVVQFSALDKLSGGLKNIIGLGRTGDQALRGLKRQARDLKGELAGVQAEMAKAGDSVGDLVARERQLESALAGVNRQIERQKRINQIDGKVGRMQARGEEMKRAGQDNMLAGAGMLTPFVLAGKSAMDFSSGMVDIQQKAELTNRETAQMSRNILAMARAAHQLPEDMRASVDVLSGFGLDPRRAMQMVEPIGRLGTAFKVDLADGAAAAYANLNNLKVPISETSRALDIMAAGGKAGAFEVKDMARWFPGLTARLQALGQKGTPAVADLTAALQVAMNTAGSADEAANNIQNLLGKINSPTVINAFAKKFGVDLPAAMAKARAEGKTTMEAFAEIAQRTTGGNSAKLGWLVEDQQAQMGLLALIQNMDKYRAIRAQIQSGSAGTVDAAFAQRQAQDASIQWKAFTGQLQATAITLGNTVLPAGTRFLSMLNGVMGAVGSWAQANPRAASTLMTLVGGLAVARIGLGALQFAFGGILGPMATAWGWFAKLRAAGSFAAAFPMVARGLSIFRIAAMGAGRAALFLGGQVLRAGVMMLANPMVLAIVAIGLALAGLGYLVYSNWGRIKAAFQNGIAAVKGSVAGLPAWMRSIGSMMMQGLLMALNPAALASRLLSIAKTGIAAFKNFFGIKSPSRLFMEMGGFITSGLAIGVDRGGAQPQRAMSRMAARAAAAGALSLSAPAFAAQPPVDAIGRAMRTAPASRPGAARAGGPATFHVEITINQRPGQSSRELAREVMQEIEQLQRRSRRGSYGDDF